MNYVVGLPDLHPGRGIPIGAAFLTHQMIYPHLIGNDIGCGIALFETRTQSRKVKRDRWVKKLESFESEELDQDYLNLLV